MTQQADFSLIKAGFMTKARTLTDYFPHSYQVTDDEADVNRGAVNYMILRPGAVPIATVPGLGNSKKIYEANWNIVFDLQVKYKSFKTAWTDFGTIRDAVLNKFVFTTDPSLPGVLNVWNVSITAPDPPGQKPPAGTPTWIGQQLIAIVTQKIDISR